MEKAMYKCYKESVEKVDELELALLSKNEKIANDSAK